MSALKSWLSRTPWLDRPLRYAHSWLTLPRELARRQPGLPSVYVGNQTALCRTRCGHRIYVDTRDLGVGALLLTEGGWEEQITSAIRPWVKPGMRIVEVGANIGYHTVQLATWVGPAGHVWAFEANPPTYRLLQRNLAANFVADRVTAIAKAAYSHAAELEFHALPNLPASSTLGDTGGEFAARVGAAAAEVQVLRVPAVPVDDELPADAVVDLVKIDAEGSEPFVLQGMTKLLARSPRAAITLEFYPMNLRMTKHDPAEFLRRLVADGFELREIDDHGALVGTSHDALLSREFSELFLTRVGAA